MKKYIAPAIQVVNLSTEDSLLTASFATNNVQSSAAQLSNKADNADWDDED